jgi:hypothetical protein
MTLSITGRALELAGGAMEVEAEEKVIPGIEKAPRCCASLGIT